MNIDRLLDLVNENFQDTFDYYKSAAVYRKKHGCSVINLDRLETDEQRHIVCAYHANDRSRSTVQGCVEVLDLNTDQANRLYMAARAVKHWYEITNWERLLPETLQDKLVAYIMG